MRIARELAQLSVKTCPELCKKILIEEKATAVLHVQVDQAIHGMLHLGMLSHKKFVDFSESNDFAINPHDPCVANKTVRGKQLTITWRVENVKLSCKDKLAVDEFIQLIRDEHENFTQVKSS